MKYDVRRRTLTLDKRPCRRCRKGQVSTQYDCTTCRGTGNGPRGGRRGCADCSGLGKHWSWDETTFCPQCLGAWERATDERWTDDIPKVAVEQMPLRVVRINRHNTWNENYLGMGCLYSAQDYGRAAATTDETMIAKVKVELKNNRVQACKVTDPDTERTNVKTGVAIRQIAKSLVIVVTSDGYSVRAEF